MWPERPALSGSSQRAFACNRETMPQSLGATRWGHKENLETSWGGLGALTVPKWAAVMTRSGSRQQRVLRMRRQSEYVLSTKTRRGCIWTLGQLYEGHQRAWSHHQDHSPTPISKRIIQKPLARCNKPPYTMQTRRASPELHQSGRPSTGYTKTPFPSFLTATTPTIHCHQPTLHSNPLTDPLPHPHTTHSSDTFHRRKNVTNLHPSPPSATMARPK